jgi:hypothetical protein
VDRADEPRPDDGRADVGDRSHRCSFTHWLVRHKRLDILADELQGAATRSAHHDRPGGRRIVEHLVFGIIAW